MSVVVAALLAACVLQPAAMALNLSCAAMGETHQADKLVMNNVWNRDFSFGTQCIYGPVAGGDASRVSWLWAWPYRTSNIPKSGPMVAFGLLPWQQTSTTPALPARISALKSANAGYDFSTHGDGSYKTALTIYLAARGKPGPEDIYAEVMIWLDARQAEPWGGRQGSLEAGGTKYQVWTGKIETWKFIVLRPAAFSTSGTVDLQGIFAALKKRHDVDGDLYVTAIALGNEIDRGSGHTEIKSFDVRF